MNPNAYRGYQFVKAWEESLINGDSTIEPVGILSGDFDTPATIIEAVRAWQEANTLREKHAHDWDDSYSEAERGAAYELWAAAFKNMVALRLPPVEETK